MLHEQWLLDQFIENQEFSDKLKSEEEIQKYTFQENISESKRALIILKSGDKIQKLAVLKSLPNLIKDETTEEALLTQVVKDLEHTDVEIQVQTGLSFITMLKEQQLEFLLDLFEIILMMLQKKSLEIVDVWIEVFQEILRRIPINMVDKQIYELVQELGTASQNHICQQVAMKMCSITIDYVKDSFPQSIIDQIKIYSQFSFQDLRVIIIKELIEKILKYQQREKNSGDFFWLEITLELIKEQNAEIKQLSIETLARTIQFYPESQQKGQIKDLFLELTNQTQECVVLAISSHLGLFIQNVFAEHEVADVRKNLLFNLPGVIFLLGEEAWNECKTFFVKSLLSEVHADVKQQALLVLFQVFKLINIEEGLTKFNQTFKQLFSSLNNVQLNIYLDQLLNIVQYIEKTHPELYHQKCLLLSELLPEMISALKEKSKQTNWRISQKLIQMIDAGLQYYNAATLEQLYPPLLYSLLDEGNAELRKACCFSLVNYIYNNPNPQKNDQIFSFIQSNFYCGKNHRQKVVYIELCQQIMVKYSRTFIKQYKLLNVLSYAYDKVPNVKSKLASILPEVKLAILDFDKENQRKFEESLKLLLKDKDSEVRAIAVRVREEMASPEFHAKLKDQVNQDQMKINSERIETQEQQDTGEELKQSDLDFILKDKKKIGYHRKQNSGCNILKIQSNPMQQPKVLTPTALSNPKLFQKPPVQGGGGSNGKSIYHENKKLSVIIQQQPNQQPVEEIRNRDRRSTIDSPVKIKRSNSKNKLSENGEKIIKLKPELPLPPSKLKKK